MFLGYLTSQGAFLCRDTSSSKVYVFRHVKFVESIFSFVHQKPQESINQSHTIATWFPPPLQIPISTTTLPLTTSSVAEAPQIQPCASQHTTLTTLEPSMPPAHTIVTRSKNNIHKPIRRMSLLAQLATTDEIEPTTVTQASKDSKWR